MKISAINRQPGHDPFPTPTPATVREMASRCTRCGLCQKDCGFLQRYGLPWDIAAGQESDPRTGRAVAFSCSLCGLCTATCPDGLDPVQMFLDLRRDAFATGDGDLSEHSRVLSYEKKGTSKRYSWYALPEGCDTVFFPGCTLPGTRPATTLRLYEYLQAGDAAMGIVLDCCTKPSHELGRHG
jgi:ferredoxin